MSSNPSFKDMPIWQRAMGLVTEVYRLTSQLPATERLGLSASLQQAAVGMPTFLASGSKSGRAGFRSACLAARRHAAEVETLLLIIQQMYPAIPVDDLLAETADIESTLTTMARRLSGDAPSPKTV
jgi:four helix bundle protein